MLLQEWNWKEAEEVWREEALEEGIEKGRKESIMQIAKTMKKDGEPIEKIVKFTGLNKEEIGKL